MLSQYLFSLVAAEHRAARQQVGADRADAVEVGPVVDLLRSEDGFGGDLQVKLSGISTVVRRGGTAEPPLFFPFFPERLAGGCSGGVIHIHVVHCC